MFDATFKAVEWFCVAWLGRLVQPFSVPNRFWSAPAVMNNSAPYEGSIKVCTWNARGLFASEVIIAQRKLEIFLELCSTHDVVLIQEAHCCRNYESFADDRLRQSHSIYWSSLPGSVAAGGVGIAISQAFLGRFDVVDSHDLVPGRIMYMSLTGHLGALDVYCIHLDFQSCSSERLRQLNLLG